MTALHEASCAFVEPDVVKKTEQAVLVSTFYW